MTALQTDPAGAELTVVAPDLGTSADLAPTDLAPYAADTLDLALAGPDERGYFGPAESAESAGSAGPADSTGASDLARPGRFGGRFVPDALVAALDELDSTWRAARADPAFHDEFAALLTGYAGRPTLLYEAHRFSAAVGARVLLKREDLLHTGAHKINNVLGQALLARRMGKSRLIAETGAGQHGVATATAAALFGMSCTVYMGRLDTERQSLNVARMRLLGADVVPVETGTGTLKDAMNEAFREWVTRVDDTHYCIGTVAGPHPYPAMVRDFARIIGVEARQQALELLDGPPDAVAACVGGGSNAIGVFSAFIGDPSVELWGFEAGGDGVDTGRHAATITGGSAGVLHGTRSYVLQDADGQTLDSHSISAGLDYPGVGPEHAHLARTGRGTYRAVTDTAAMEAMGLLSRTEGIIPAIETAHALAGVHQIVAAHAAAGRPGRPTVLVCLSGRGDKDMGTAASWFGISGTGPGLSADSSPAAAAETDA
jgi:tryptophan synthase beta chain